MADQKVNELSTATPALTDYIMGMGSSAEYKALVSAVAKKIVEDYAGSSLAGSNQSIKAALDGLNSNLNGARILVKSMPDNGTVSFVGTSDSANYVVFVCGVGGQRCAIIVRGGGYTTLQNNSTANLTISMSGRTLTLTGAASTGATVNVYAIVFAGNVS